MASLGRILFTLSLLIPCHAIAQSRVPARNLYERVISIVPMVGSGTLDDPKRPMFAPNMQGIRPADYAGKTLKEHSETLGNQIVEYTYELSDDGQYAIVEFVARNPQALNALLQSARTDVKVFRKGWAKRADIELEAKKVKKSFDLDRFAGLQAATATPTAGGVQ